MLNGTHRWPLSMATPIGVTVRFRTDARVESTGEAYQSSARRITLKADWEKNL